MHSLSHHLPSGYRHDYGAVRSDADGSRWEVEVVNVYDPPSLLFLLLPLDTQVLSLCCDPHRPHFEHEGTLRHKVMASLAVKLTPIKRQGEKKHVSRAFAGFETLRHIQNETEEHFKMPSHGLDNAQ